MFDQSERLPSSPYYAYMEESRKPVASLLLVLPFLLIYHIGIWALRLSHQDIANGADVMLAKILNAAYYCGVWLYGQVFPGKEAQDSAALWFLGVFGPLFSLFLLIFALLLRQHMVATSWRVRIRTLGLMSLECVAFAIPPFGLAWMVNGIAALQNNAADPGGWFAGIVLSLGAGVYEEFLFRMLLMGALLWGFENFLRLKGTPLHVCAILGQALAFSAFHYLPWAGESFDLQVFSFRTLAGIYFAYIYQERRFGIAAGSHAIYDVFALIVNRTG